ncbi:MAG: murein biosynthesis integral membrane protein MurJ [Pseudomonadota bacterium]
MAMSLARSFLTVSGMTMISRVLGLAREIMIAAILGAGPIAEAFFVAFRFPNLFRRFFAEGAFNMAFVPLFAKRLEGDGADAARRFGEEALSGLLSVLFVLVLAAQLAMPWLIYVIAAGFADDPDKLSMAVLFAQIQFPYLLFMSLTALFSGVLNSLGKFAVAAGAPILLNLSMIGAMAAAWALEEPVGHWLSWSVFTAGVLQFLLVAGAARRAGIRLKLRAPRWTADMKRLVTLGAPGAVAGGVTQINILIGTTIATFFDGAVAWLTYADRVYQLPLGVVGVAIGVALLPELSRRVRAEDAAGAVNSINRAIEFSLVLTVPAAVALLVIPDTVVRLLFARGAFGETDVMATSHALALFALGLPAYVLIKALSPAFFADEDTRTPLRYSVVSMIVNVVISVGLAPLISWSAIPIGTAVAAWVNVWLLWRGIGETGVYKPDERLKRRCSRAIAAALFMGLVLYTGKLLYAGALTEPFLKYPYGVALILAGLASYAIAALALGAFRRSDLSELRGRRAQTPPAA